MVKRILFLVIASLFASLGGVSAQDEVTAEVIRTCSYVRPDLQGASVLKSVLDYSSTGDWSLSYMPRINKSEGRLMHLWKDSKNWATAYVAMKLGFNGPHHTIITYKVHCKAYVDAASYGSACAISEIYDYGASYHPDWDYVPASLYSAEFCDIKPNRNIYDSNVKRRVGMRGTSNGRSNEQTSEDYTFTVTIDNGSGSSARKEYRVVGLHGNENKSGSTSNHSYADFRAWYEVTSISYVREVVFDNNGGIGYMENEYGNWGFKLDKCTYKNYGYEFDGWSTTRNGPKEYDDEATMPTPSASDYGKITLYARWKPIIYTYTYKCQDGNGGYRIVGTKSAQVDKKFPALEADTYSNPENRSTDDYYLAGYYSQPDGKETHLYSHDLTPLWKYWCWDEDLTMYAHYVRKTYDVYWDYTYQTSQGSYTNIDEADGYNRIKIAFLDLSRYNADEYKYEKFKHIKIFAPEVQNNTSVTEDFATHTKAHTKVHLCLRSSVEQKDITEGENVYIYLTDEELSSIKIWHFSPWHEYANQPRNWMTFEDKDQYTTVFAFSGDNNENLYQQKWRVNLEGLQVYPEHIYVMPLFRNDVSQWVPISQLANTTGVRCDKAQDGNYYTGSFPVWKNQSVMGHTSVYAIGIVGFSLGGKFYFMNKQNEGAWEPRFTSTETNDQTHPDNVINYTISGSEIPVVRFMADKTKGEQLSRFTPEILVTSYGEKITDFATTYQATREGYLFTGWEDAEHNPVPAQGSDLVVTSAHTVYPRWLSNEFTITLRNGEGMEDGSVTAIYGQKLPDVTPPVRTGYTFGGYYSTQGDVETLYYDAEGKSTIVWDKLYDITLNARWTPLQYTITLKNGDGFEDVTATATYGQPWPWIQRPIREDASFEGYYTDEDGAGTKYFDKNGNLMPGISQQWNLTEDLTLYANWKDYVAMIEGGGYYNTLSDAVYNVKSDGSDKVILLKDIILDSYVRISRPLTLDLNNHSIINNETTFDATPLLYTNKNVTICGCGSIRNTKEYAIQVADSKLDINIEGSVQGVLSAVRISSIGTGTVNINSGEYSITGTSKVWGMFDGYTYNTGNAIFIVKGGTFIGSDPAHLTMSRIPNQNIVADGYTSYKGNNAWTVLPNTYNVIFTTGDDVGGYKLSEGDDFNLQDAGFGKMTITEDVANVNVNYTRAITKDWQSWYAPFDVQLTNAHSDLTFAQITGLGTDSEGNEGLIYTEVTSGTLSANTPYIVRRNSEESQEYTFQAGSVSKTESRTTYFDVDNDRYAFTGVYNAIALAGNPYWAFDLKGMMAWTDLDNAIENPMRFIMRIYNKDTGSYKVVDPRASGKNAIRLINHDEATSILSVTETETSDATMYDLQGRKITHPAKGIYITNGKKRLIK